MNRTLKEETVRRYHYDTHRTSEKARFGYRRSSKRPDSTTKRSVTSRTSC